MFDGLIDNLLALLLKAFRLPQIATAVIACLPIVEARLAIPIGIGLNMGFFQSWLYAFIGSSALAPVLLLVLIPFVRFLASTRLFRRIGSALLDRFEKKSRSSSLLAGDENAENRDMGSENANPKGGEKPKRKLSAENKKMLGVFLFVAVPLPLTGVWTGCAIASIVRLGYKKSLLAVLCGNLAASLIILLLCRFFSAYINYIILALGIIAAIVVVALIVKLLLHKPDDEKKPD